MNAFVFILLGKMNELELMVYREEDGLTGAKDMIDGRQLVYYEIYDSLLDAEVRKETIESWPEKKVRFLINFVNPTWKDWKEEIKN